MYRVAMPQPHSDKPEYNERSTHCYTEALEAVGLEPVVLDGWMDSAEIAQVLSECQGVLLPGSPADVEPQKYGEERQPETSAADPLRDNLDELLIQDAHGRAGHEDAELGVRCRRAHRRHRTAGLAGSGGVEDQGVRQRL